MKVREEVARVLEQARQEKQIGGSLEASLALWADGELYRFLESHRAMLPGLFIVSGVILHQDTAAAPAEAISGEALPLKLAVQKAPGSKCPRCWVYSAAEGGSVTAPPSCPGNKEAGLIAGARSYQMIPCGRDKRVK